MLARKMIFAVAAVATLGVAAPAFAGEGSPDTNMGPYGNWGSGPTYPYTTSQPDAFVTEPAYPSAGYYDDDANTGYAPRTRVMPNDERYMNERYMDDDDFAE
jgi:hypothetical protein